jgi:protein arginine N-methyltransferase 1
VYALADYGAMMFDRVRMDAFVRALEATVRPGDVVVDIGSGTGIFALLACRFGARRVYAIEPADVIQVAREVAAANGLAGRIEFIQALSSEVSLPERARVIVSDLSGATPWFERHLPSIRDARERLLAADGVLIPRRDTAWAAVVEVADFYAKWSGPWQTGRFGFDMGPAWTMAANTLAAIRIEPEHLLTDVERWAAIDYATFADVNATARLVWRARRSGIGHGIAIGFDRVLAEGIGCSNAPDARDEARATIYPTLFLPWPSAVPLDAGDSVDVALDVRLVRGTYIWNWTTGVSSGADGRDRASRDAEVKFEQSTFFGVPVSPGTLRGANGDATRTSAADRSAPASRAPRGK